MKKLNLEQKNNIFLIIFKLIIFIIYGISLFILYGIGGIK